MFKELFQQDQSPELSQNLKFTTDSDSFTCGQRCLVGCHGNRPKESGESRSKPQLNHRFPGSSFFSLYYEIKTSSSHFLVMLMFSSRQFISLASHLRLHPGALISILFPVQNRRFQPLSCWSVWMLLQFSRATGGRFS